MYTTSDNDEIYELLKTNPTSVSIEIGNNIDFLIDTHFWPKISKQNEEIKNGKCDFLARYWFDGKSLDFGCGTGGAVLSANNIGKDSIGYDINKLWQDNEKLTTDFKYVENNSPYDTIIMFDVLDHMLGVANNSVVDHRSDWSFHIDTLKKMKSLLTKSGKILVRCHPYISADGAHNDKAYAHLLGRESIVFTHKIIRPQSTYDLWFKSAGLNQVRKNITLYKLPPLIRQRSIQEKIIELWDGDDFVITKERLENVISVQYVDFELQ